MAEAGGVKDSITYSVMVVCFFFSCSSSNSKDIGRNISELCWGYRVVALKSK